MNVPGFIPSNRLIPDIGPIDGSFGSLASITEDELDTYYRANFGDESKGPRYYRLITGSSGGDRELALKNFLQAYIACISFFVDDQIVRVLDVLENG